MKLWKEHLTLGQLEKLTIWQVNTTDYYIIITVLHYIHVRTHAVIARTRAAVWKPDLP